MQFRMRCRANVRLLAARRSGVMLSGAMLSGVMLVVLASAAAQAQPDAGAAVRGRWAGADGTTRFELIEGFAPSQGAAVIYRDGRPNSVERWRMQGSELSVGYGVNGPTTLQGDRLQVGREVFTRQPNAAPPPSDLLDLKRQPEQFVASVVRSDWVEVGERDRRRWFVPGFSPVSGVTHELRAGQLAETNPWAVADGVLRLGRNAYPNGRLVGGSLLIQGADDRYRLFERSTNRRNAEALDPEPKQDAFLAVLTTGRWMQSPFGEPQGYEFRPLFGDLHGMRFEYRSGRFRGGEAWELARGTGAIKIGPTEYPAVRIVGDTLMLRDRQNAVSGFLRAPGPAAERATAAEVRLIQPDERQPDQLRAALAGQWIRADFTYVFEFTRDGRRGLMHEFRSLPFTLAGDRLRFGESAGFSAVRVLGDKLVLGDGQLSLERNADAVGLSPVGVDHAAGRTDKPEARPTPAGRSSAVVQMRDGRSLRFPLPGVGPGDAVRITVEND